MIVQFLQFVYNGSVNNGCRLQCGRMLRSLLEEIFNVYRAINRALMQPDSLSKVGYGIKLQAEDEGRAHYSKRM